VIGALIILTGGLLFSLPVYGLLELSAGLPVWARWLLTALLLKPAFALRSLITAGVQVLRALQAGDLPAARRLVALHLVSRDTSHLSPGQVASAAVESLAENLTDSFLSPLFYFALGGVPLAWFYRFVNTADAMIGYHTPQYEYLGKFAARLDDVLNWLPARVAAFSIVLSAGLLGLDAGSALRVMRTQHRRTNSPNAGWTMAAISGALGVRLEKIGAYQLNEQCALPENRSIESACRLVAVAALICLIFCAGVMYAVSRLA
jgi:adenosylcobinamide-phosphate synthase